MTTFPTTLDKQFTADFADMKRRLALVEQQAVQGAGSYAAFPCTSSTRPAAPRTGQEIYETDTGATALYSGTAWLHGATQVGTSILGASAPSIAIPAIPPCTHLFGVFLLRTDTGSGGAFTTMRFNSDSGAHYTWQYLYGNGAGTTAGNSGGLVTGIRFAVAPGAGDTASYFAAGDFTVGGSSSAVAYKTVASRYQGPTNSGASYSGGAGGLWESTAAITRVEIFPGAGNFVAGSALTLYGLL
jgi:hypothetical protein